MVRLKQDVTSRKMWRCALRKTWSSDLRSLRRDEFCREPTSATLGRRSSSCYFVLLHHYLQATLHTTQTDSHTLHQNRASAQSTASDYTWRFVHRGTLSQF